MSCSPSLEVTMKTGLFDRFVVGAPEESIELIDSLLESSVEYSIAGVGPDGKFIFWNEGARRLYGYEHDEVVNRLDWSVLFSEKELQSGRLADIKARALREHKWEGTIDQVCKDGTSFTANVDVAPRRNVFGKPTGFLFVSRDIQAVISAQQQFASSNNRLPSTPSNEVRDATRLKEDFIATTGHALRTPLSAILGASELLLGTSLSPEQLELATAVQKSTNTLMGLISDILDMSKLKAGRLVLDIVEFDPAAIVKQVTDAFAELADDRLLKITSMVDRQVSSILFGDPERVRQVLTNLVGNAVKFAYQGGILVRMQVDGENENTVVLKFSVTDTGVGIPDVEQQLLFEPFTQLEISGTRCYEGVGLGLSLSKALVELMGGEMGVSSSEQKGATFWFTVPLRRSFDATRARQGRGTAQVISVAVPTAGPSDSDEYAAEILVVEDNPVLQAVAVNQLARLGFNARAVPDGKTALSAAGENRYALILMDCYLPGIDGFETTRTIRQMESETGVHIPIIAVTASGMRETADKCYAAGMDDFLSKPYTLDQLQQKISRWLAVPSPAQRLTG